MDPLGFLFQAVSSWTGFPIDQVRLVIMLVLCYPLGFFFHHILSPRHVSVTVRHAFSASVGIAVGWICIQWQMVLLFGLVGGSYALLLLLPPTVVQRYTMLWGMAYLAICNVYRLMSTTYGDYTVDFSGPMMIQVTRVTYVAFAVHDGLAKKESDLNNDQRSQRVYARPSVLEYMSYTFNFHSLLAGPTYTLREHLSFMDGSYKVQVSDDPVKPLNVVYPYFAIVSKLIYALLCISLMIGVGQYYSIDNLLDPTYMRSFPSMPITVFFAEFLFYYRYYFIWLLAESINNAAGLGFNGFDKSGNPKWDLVRNAGVLDTQLALNIRVATTEWNATCALWLRRVVYERVQFSPPLVTMLVCAWWHGFYPAYYVSFLFIGISVVAARKMRRLVRPYFQSTNALKRFYDVITHLVTRITLDFGMFVLPFLTLEKALLYWSYYYYIPLVVVCAVAFLVPVGRRREKAADAAGASVEATSGSSEAEVEKVKAD